VTGDAAGLQGNYSGSYGIGGLLDKFPGDMVNLTLSNETQQTVAVQGNYLVVGSTFAWDGFNPSDGNIHGIVAAQDSYVRVGSTLLIARETWNWIEFYCEFPDCFSP
jgi:hypothetical protein